MSLYHKYRPATFDVVGCRSGSGTQIGSLKKIILMHIFCTALPVVVRLLFGRIIATELGCSEDDFKEMDSADFRGIDTIREIRRQSQYKPLSGKCRVWLLDEVHRLTNDAQSALLKSVGRYTFACLLCTGYDRSTEIARNDKRKMFTVSGETVNRFRNEDLASFCCKSRRAEID